MTPLQISQAQADAMAPPGGPACAPCQTGPRPATDPGPVLPADPADDWLVVVLLDDDGLGVAEQPVEIELDSGVVLSGRTDRDGRVRFDGVPRGLGQATFAQIPVQQEEW